MRLFVEESGIFFPSKTNKPLLLLREAIPAVHLAHSTPILCPVLLHLPVNYLESEEKEVPEGSFISHSNIFNSVGCLVVQCILNISEQLSLCLFAAGSWGGGPSGGYPSIGLDSLSNPGYNAGMVRLA